MISDVAERTESQDLPKKKPKTSFDLGTREDLCVTSSLGRGM